MNNEETINNKENDLQTFNKRFEIYTEEEKVKIKKIEEERLSKMEENKVEKEIYQLNIYEILVGIKDTWFNIMDDIIGGRINIEMITKEDRMFYIGITLIMIVIMIYIYEEIFIKRD